MELERRQAVHFILAGEGEQSISLKRVAGNSSNITFTGWLRHADIRWLLERSAVGLIPCRSVIDTTPNKLFEYMSAGLPVISSLEGETADIIAKSEIGLSYRCGDADELYCHVSALADDDAMRKRLADNSRSVFRRHFSETALYAKYA
jgi:glycosyltransferase involved in cell wall biosynthesis